MMTEDSFDIGSFNLALQDIRSVDPDSLLPLSIGVGWPHRLSDWLFLLENGRGLVALDTIGRVCASAMWFIQDDDYATIGMMITPPRLQARGTARHMMEHVIREIGPRAIGLNATRAAYRLYLNFGFTPERKVYQHQGIAVPSPSMPQPLNATGEIRDITPDDMAEIHRLDSTAYHADRRAILTHLITVSDGAVLTDKNRIRGYALCRKFGRGRVIGPIIAQNEADAIALTRWYIRKHPGEFLRVDTRHQNGTFRDVLSACGLQFYDTVTTMSLKRPVTTDNDFIDDNGPNIFGLASQTLG
ncbi:GNAT family N-acetyltransferase [Thalassospira sp.]|uniref:GNAT family N-acetyltransferase n=1 Tax=Thalassospira sp. TaxID=1912094 RepID=UPI0027324533|nr:GNAT family N-acetyltransferase [Thalassospira sp.]MDP2699833.1 GNAT family N-acetyltransferase [Thalassospira sp.]